MGSECTAYWFKHQAGEENTIYLYRKDEFICEMTTTPTFHKARIEQDDIDLEAMARMQSFTNEQIKLLWFESNNELNAS